MKKNLLIFLSVIPIFVFSQISIGNKSVTDKSNISLEFNNAKDNPRGLILPWVSTLKDYPVTYDSITGAGYQGMTGVVVDGTIIFDLSDKTIKYKSDGNWIDLTGDIGFPLEIKDSSNKKISLTKFNEIDSSLQDNEREAEHSKIVIGKNAESDTTEGILVLSDQDRAMVLPKVEEPYLNIVNPSAGMIVYDTKNKLIALFNGTIWSFWKP